MGAGETGSGDYRCRSPFQRSTLGDLEGRAGLWERHSWLKSRAERS